MNYVQHTRAAHQQLAGQPAATPHHVSLYWALFFAWNAARFPASLPLNHADLMQAAHIGNEKTYRAALRDLQAWQLLLYNPSHTRYQPSTCQLTDPSDAPGIGGNSAPYVSPSSGPELPELLGTGATSAPDATLSSEAEVPQPLRAELPLMPPASGADVPQHSLYSKTGTSSKPSISKPTPFGRSAAPHPEKKIGEKAPTNEKLSGAELSGDESTPPITPPKTGSRAATIRQAATARSGRPPRPEITFAESEYADVEKFIQAFEGTDYALADLRLYHEKVRLWRDRKTGEPPRRRDWLATAQRFMLNDAHDNRLKLAPPAPPRGAPAGPGGHQPGSTIDALYEQFYPRRPG